MQVVSKGNARATEKKEKRNRTGKLDRCPELTPDVPRVEETQVFLFSSSKDLYLYVPKQLPSKQLFVEHAL